MMEIKANKQENKLTITLIGMLNTMSSPQLEDYINKHLDGVEELVFDFAKLEYITSSGLRVLLRAQKRMDHQGKMAIMHMNAEIREVFELTGFLDMMTILE